MLIFLGIMLVIVGLILIYWKSTYSPLKFSFHKKIKSQLADIEVNNNICTQEEIERLPELLRRYCEKIGLVGTKKYNAVNGVFRNTKFVFDANKGTILNMDYDLWLFCDKPMRTALCETSIMGIPFEGVDYCNKDKIGGMKGVLGKALQIFHTYNQQIYQAGLITWLAEGACINPSILLSNYVSYETLNETQVKAMISYNGVSGNGIFTFNHNGVLISFESDERQEELVDGIMTKLGWRIEYEGIVQANELLIPRTVRAIKVFPDKEVIYFDATDFDVILYK